MKRKKILIQLTIMAAIMGMTLTTNPVITKAEVKNLSVVEQNNKKLTWEYYNQTALDFLNYCDKESLKKYDSSLYMGMTEAQAKEMKAYIEENILKGETTDYKKAKLIYDWIWQNVKYGYNKNRQIGFKPYDVFTIKHAVCGGYSNLYKSMLNLVDIPAVVVTGDTSMGAHAWNIVYANNKWFFSDSTWGDKWGRYFDNDVKVSSTDHKAEHLDNVSVSNGSGLILGYNKGVSVVGVDNSMSSVVVPEKYKELDIISVSYDLFKDNYNVQHIFISDKINEIEISASENKLKSIEVSNNNPKYASKDGVLYTKDFSNLLIYPLKKENTDFTIQKETTSYDSKETFANKNLKNIYVEDGNKNFSSYDGAVYNYDKTKLLTIPEGKESITVSGGVELDNTIFAFKTNLKIVKLNNGIKKIPSYAFNGCTSLKDIYIPNTVTEIDSYAFEKVDLNNLTIYAEENTYAEKYANENKIKFVNLTQKNRQAVLNKINTLNSLIEKFDKIDSNKYTEDSMLNLKSAIMSARNLVKKSNLTEKQVDEEIDNLYTAVKTLKEI